MPLKCWAYKCAPLRQALFLLEFFCLFAWQEIFISVYVLHDCMPEEDLGFPRTANTDSCELSNVDAGNHSGPLEKEYT